MCSYWANMVPLYLLQFTSSRDSGYLIESLVFILVKRGIIRICLKLLLLILLLMLRRYIRLKEWWLDVMGSQSEDAIRNLIFVINLFRLLTCIFVLSLLGFVGIIIIVIVPEVSWGYAAALCTIFCIYSSLNLMHITLKMLIIVQRSFIQLMFVHLVSVLLI